MCVSEKRESDELKWFLVQPHGFFNCSPAVDIPPSELAVDDVGVKEAPVKRDSMQPNIMSKL